MSTTTSAGRAPSAGQTEPGIDPRAPQFNAAVTMVVLVAVLATAGTVVATVLSGIQAALFAIGAVAGVRRTPHAWVFRTLIRPRVGAPDHLEDPRPPQFAQAVGLVFTGVATVAFIAGATVAGEVAVALALVAATLNAVFRFCLGCEIYLLIKRATN